MLRVVLLCFSIWIYASSCYAQSIFEIYDVANGYVIEQIEKADISSVTIDRSSRSQRIGLLFIKMYQSHIRRRYSEVETLLQKASKELKVQDSDSIVVSFNPNDGNRIFDDKTIEALKSGKEVSMVTDPEQTKMWLETMYEGVGGNAELVLGDENSSLGAQLYETAFFQQFEKVPSGILNENTLITAIKDCFYNIKNSLETGKASSSGKYYARAEKVVSELVLRDKSGYISYPSLISRYCTVIPDDEADRITTCNAITKKLREIPKDKQDRFFHVGLSCYQAALVGHEEGFERYMAEFKMKYADSPRGKLMLSYLHGFHVGQLIEKLESDCRQRKPEKFETVMSVLPLISVEQQSVVAEEIFTSLLYYIASGLNVPNYERTLEMSYGYFSRFLVLPRVKYGKIEYWTKAYKDMENDFMLLSDKHKEINAEALSLGEVHEHFEGVY